MSAAGIKSKREAQCGSAGKVAFRAVTDGCLLRIIRENIKPDCMIDADCYRSYDETDTCAFSHCSAQKHRFLEKLRCRINHNTHFAGW